MIDLARDIIDLIESRAHNGRNAGRIVEALFTKIFTALRRDPRFDALTQAKQLQEVAETVPKGLKWKTRARVGDRVRWYELPEEVDH